MGVKAQLRVVPCVDFPDAQRGAQYDENFLPCGWFIPDRQSDQDFAGVSWKLPIPRLGLNMTTGCFVSEIGSFRTRAVVATRLLTGLLQLR